MILPPPEKTRFLPQELPETGKIFYFDRERWVGPFDTDQLGTLFQANIINLKTPISLNGTSEPQKIGDLLQKVGQVEVRKAQVKNRIVKFAADVINPREMKLEKLTKPTAEEWQEIEKALQFFLLSSVNAEDISPENSEKRGKKFGPIELAYFIIVYTLCIFALAGLALESGHLKSLNTWLSNFYRHL